MALDNIAWLASYPKSGNTWTRAFLINYLLNPAQPVPINQIHRLGMGDAVVKSYAMMANGPFDPRDPNQSLELRPKVIDAIARNQADLNFVKTHNMNDQAFGTPLIDRKYTKCAIYIIRNPLDMVLSYARHYGRSIDATVEGIGRPDNVIEGSVQNVRMYLGSWSDHVRSWADCPDFPVHVIRYEDMASSPEEAFRGVLEFLNIPLDEERLSRAIRHSSFDELSKQERETGFIERSNNNATFFHTGRTGQWKRDLATEQADQIVSDHRKVMKRFGYI